MISEKGDPYQENEFWLYSFIYFKKKIIIQLQLYAFSPHPSTFKMTLKIWLMIVFGWLTDGLNTLRL